MRLPDLRSVKNEILGLRRDVIRMMRLKFIAVAMGILIVVFLIMLTAINMIMQKVSQSQSMQLLQQIASSQRYDSFQNDEGFSEGGFAPGEGGTPGMNKRPEGGRPPEGSDPSPEGNKPPAKPSEHPDTSVKTAALPDDVVVMLLSDHAAGGDGGNGDGVENGNGDGDSGNGDGGGQQQNNPWNWGAWGDANWWSNLPTYGAPGGQQNPGGGDQQNPGGDGQQGGGQQDSGGGQQNPWNWGWGGDQQQNPWNWDWSGGGQQNPWNWGDQQNPWGGGQQNPWNWGDQQNPWNWDPNWWNQQGNGDGDKPKETEPPTTAAPTAPPTTAPPPTEPPTTHFEPKAVPHQSESQRETTTLPMPSEPVVPADVLPMETEPPAAAPTHQTTAAVTTVAPTETTTTTTAAAASTPAPTSPAPAPPEPREVRMDRWKVPITIDHFAIFVDQDGQYLGLRNTEDYTDEEAEEIMNGILSRQKTEGMYGWLQFCTASKQYGTLIVVTDKTSDQGILNNLFRTTVIIGIFMLLVLLMILIVLSNWITLPVQQAFKRQKQFVSDAGHELKTPLAVLTTNADILQDEIGANRWLTYIQEQIGRMNQLVGDLLRLARMDNATQEYEFKDFDLSMAVAATALPFESTAFEKSKNLEMDIQPDVHYCGSEQHIRQLCAIFIDNAIKYSNENGIIKIVLLQRGEHPVIEFYNTGCEISPAETQKIFERFYRGDKARTSSRQSGYGLGLAIAKSIMDVHKIKFHVTCEQGRWIRFLLTL